MPLLASELANQKRQEKIRPCRRIRMTRPYPHLVWAPFNAWHGSAGGARGSADRQQPLNGDVQTRLEAFECFHDAVDRRAFEQVADSVRCLVGEGGAIQ